MLQDANVAYNDDVENFIVDDMLCSVDVIGRDQFVDVVVDVAGLMWHTMK